jgi:DNA mismatch endonuclease (patch repair protein)
MTDWLTIEQRSRNMSAIRSSGTLPERRLAAALRFLFPRRRVVHHPDLPGRPDFYLPGLRLALFADGCFWHGCPTHGRTPDCNLAYWRPKLERNAARDRSVMLELRRMGIRPLRLWDHELRPAVIESALQRIKSDARRPRLLGRPHGHASGSAFGHAEKGAQPK